MMSRLVKPVGGDSPELSETANRPDHCECDVVFDLGVGPGQVYNEEAFRYFLADEHKRTQASGRPFLVLLVDLQDCRTLPLDEKLARTLFSRLSLCLRETDIVGWYREGRIAGAVLTHLSDATLPAVPSQVRDRVDELVRGALPTDLSNCLRVRVFQVPSVPDSQK
jgi:hypothetical protein